MLVLANVCARAAPPEFARVIPDRPLTFPADTGAHPDFRTEWWYATGWLETPDKKPLGFQVTFFRSATGHDAANPSRFAPKQLIIAHAALSDPSTGKLAHDQKVAREGFGIAHARVGNTDVKLEDWTFLRAADGSYTAHISGTEFSLALKLTPTQKPLLQGVNGYSQKGPRPEQASYYYSEPQLRVTGTVTRRGKAETVGGHAWLDHEWSSTVLDPQASGWDWLGANMTDGSALMAFQIRDMQGAKLWSHATLREANGTLRQYGAAEVDFKPQRSWRSPHTNASYPVAQEIRTGTTRWQLTPLQDDQELDSRRSTGSVYWEGAVTITRDSQPAGHGYLEMTGYLKPLKL